MRKTVFFLLLAIAAAPSSSFGQQPMEIVQQGVEGVVRILEDPLYQDGNRKEDQRQKLWEIMFQVYDFREFSRRVLGAHWKSFNRQQRDEFVRVFSEFLGKFYIGRLQERYNQSQNRFKKEWVSYLRQQMISDTLALVEIEVDWKNRKIPATIRLTNRTGKWKVYDLSVMGINAVGIYRAQFKWMLSKKSPQQTIGRIKKKIAELDGEL
jgi:phospholipid transport system substrate-binding protein